MSPELELVILIGLQASGKTTFWSTHFSESHVHSVPVRRRIKVDMNLPMKDTYSRLIRRIMRAPGVR
jgi:predicted kinase